MSEQNNKEVLLIDDSFIPLLTENEAENMKFIQKKFMESYIIHKDNMSVEEWLSMELQLNLPEKSDEEIEKISSDIISTIKLNEEKKYSLEQTIKNGRSKESWLALELKRAPSHMNTQGAVKYLQNLDNALSSVNDELYGTIVTKNGTVNFNPQLDGFIAEQYHAQTFNLNAEATGSEYRAKVLQPEGKCYTTNSVDIVIIDGNKKVVRRYQSKYCKDAESTLDAFNKGDYRGQRKLVPDGQENDIKNATNVIEAPDGTKSNPLTKQFAKDLQKEAQNGKWNDLNWSEYKIKDLAIGIGKQAGQAALMGAAIGVGFNVAQKVWKGEQIDGKEVVETALSSGADFGIKAATAGAIKVGTEKGIIRVIPKGTPTETIASIVHVGIENIKVIGKIATGELTLKEGFNKMEQVTVSTVAAIKTSVKGAKIGETIGTVFDPVGKAVGGFIGGTVGYMQGSKVGDTIVKGVQKVREVTKNVIKSAGNKVISGVSNFCSSCRRLFCW